MCGRSAFTAEVTEVVEEFALARAPATIEPRYNIAPSYSGVGAPWIVRVGADGKRELVEARWWLIPSFWNRPLSELPSSFNARAEDITNKTFFKAAFAARRCIMPASGWYEYRGPRGHKESYFFHLPGRPTFGFAGIYETWVSPADGEVVTSFAIVTSAPTVIAAKIHDRMPVVLPKSAYDVWLDPSYNDTEQLQKLLQPWSGELDVYETNGYGNDPRHEGPECLKPVAQQSLIR